MEGLIGGIRTRNIRGHAPRLGVLLLLLLAGMLILGARQSVYAADISGAVSSSALEANKAVRLTANTTLTIDADKTVTSIDLNGYRLTIQGSRTLTLTSGIKDGDGSTNTVGLTVNSGNLAVQNGGIIVKRYGMSYYQTGGNVTINNTTSDGYSVYGLYFQNVRVTGGTLTVTASSNSAETYGIESNSFRLASGTVNVTATNTNTQTPGYDSYAYALHSNYSNVEITSGTLTAQATSQRGSSYGAYWGDDSGSGTISIRGFSTKLSLTGNYDGLYTEGTLYVSDGASVTTAGERRYGLYSSKKISISGEATVINARTTSGTAAVGASNSTDPDRLVIYGDVLGIETPAGGGITAEGNYSYIVDASGNKAKTVIIKAMPSFAIEITAVAVARQDDQSGSPGGAQPILVTGMDAGGTVTVTKNGGTPVTGGIVHDGDQVTLNAEAAAGYRFLGFYEGTTAEFTDSLGTNTTTLPRLMDLLTEEGPLTYTASEAKAYTAVFIVIHTTPDNASDTSTPQGGSAALASNVNEENAQTVYYRGIAWRVIGYDGAGGSSTDANLSVSGTMTLLASGQIPPKAEFDGNGDDGFYNKYAGSTLKLAVDAIGDGFSTGEKNAIQQRTLQGGSGNYGSSGYSPDRIRGTAVTTQLWPLSAGEASLLNSELRKNAGEWWLRSPGGEDIKAAYVRSTGLLNKSGEYVDGWDGGVRPAFYVKLSSILLTSAAEGGKSSGTLGPQALTAVSATEENSEWKLTLPDTAHAGFSVDTEAVAFDGETSTVTIPYSGAATGQNEYISAVTKDSTGNVVYYGRLALASAAADASVTIDIGGKFGCGDQLYVFNEQYHEEKEETDYASPLQLIPLPETCGHTYEEPVYSWSEDLSSCTALMICWDCGDEVTETVVANSQVAQEATCTEAGEKIYTAIFTNPAFTEKSETETIAALGHDLVSHEGQAATCTESGWEAYETCSRCDYTTYEEIPAIGHTETLLPAVEPTCTEDGKTLGMECSVCHEIMTAQETIPALGHDYNAVVKESTCEEDGYTTYTCTRCGDHYTENEIPALGHSWQFTHFLWNWGEALSDVTVEYYCDRCWSSRSIPAMITETIREADCEHPVVHVYQASISAEAAPDGIARDESSERVEEYTELGHDWDEPVWEWQEETDGRWTATVTFTCQRDKTHQITVSADRIDPEDWVAQCEVDGWSGYTAAVYLDDQEWTDSLVLETFPATGHDWYAMTGETKWASDYSSAKVQLCCTHDPDHRRTCTAEVTNEVERAADCVEGGVIVHTATAVYDGQTITSEIREETSPDPTAHRRLQISYTWEEDYSSVTAECWCDACGSLISEEVADATGEVVQEADCETDGIVIYRAEFRNSGIFEPQEKRKWIPAFDHDWDEVRIVWAKDNRSATATRVCRNDSSHVLSETSTVKAWEMRSPSCTEEGEGFYEVLFTSPGLAGQYTKDYTIPKTAHDWDYASTEYQWNREMTKLTAIYGCRNCWEQKTETGKITSKVTKEPTTSTDGIRTYTGTFSNKNLQTQTKKVTIPKTGEQILDMNVSVSSREYNGKAQKPAVVKIGSKTLKEGTDYTAKYQNNINVGEATVTITGKGNYYTAKPIVKKFRITAVGLQDATISGISDKIYTGAAVKPAPVVKMKVGGKTVTLKAGTDYTVTYKDNTNVGLAFITIKGKGNFIGTKGTTFRIKAKSIEKAAVNAIADQAYDGSYKTPVPTVKLTLNGKAVTLKNGTDYRLSYASNLKPGTATVTIYGKGNFTGTISKTFKIVNKNAIERFSGDDRYATSLAIAEEYRRMRGVKQFDTLIVADGINYPDALAASYLGTAKNCPIISVAGPYPNHQGTQKALAYIKKNLKPQGQIYIVGGPGSVDPVIENTLKASGFKVKRLAGSNRYLTNLEILKEVQLGDIAPFIVCIGTDYADALSASAAGRPILLVNGVKLTAEQKAYLQGRHPHRIWVIGEFTTVGADVVSELTQYASVEMVGSGNSYSRSLAIARYFFQGSQPRISIASGGNFADGLCGGPLAVLKNTPLLLTDNSVAGNRRIAAYAVDVQAYQLTIFGGPGSVPEATAKAVLSLN